jgi:hypothetical protein
MTLNMTDASVRVIGKVRLAQKKIFAKSTFQPALINLYVVLNGIIPQSCLLA